MDFLKENKGKLLMAAFAAAMGGFFLVKSKQQVSESSIKSVFSKFMEKNKLLSSEDDKKELSNKTRKELYMILKNNMSKEKTKQEKEELYIQFFIQCFQIYYKQIKDLSDDQQYMKEVLESYRDLIGIIFQLGILGNQFIEKGEENMIDTQECFKLMFINNYEVEEKIDALDFIFSSLHFIREEDAIQFINSRIIEHEDLKNLFLSKLIRHSHTCLKLSGASVDKLSNSDFYFANQYFEKIKDFKFLKTLDNSYLITSLTLFNHFCSTFNKNLEYYTLKETFLYKWQKLFQNILGSEEYIKHLSVNYESKVMTEIFKQLTFNLFNYTIAFNLEDKMLNNYVEAFQQRLITFCSVMITAEESLKTMDIFLRNLKNLGLFEKYKSAFMCIIHDFMVTLVDFYQKNSCSNFFNILIQSVTLMITYSHSCIPSSQTIHEFWKSFKLPPDCSVDFITEPYFRMNLAQFFEVTGLVVIAETLSNAFKTEELQRKVRMFLQIVNNKRCAYNRLRIIGYQYSVLSSDFEDLQVQQTIIKHLFRAEPKDNRSFSFSLLNVCEKIFTPLHFISQTHIEKDIISQEEKDFIYEQIKKFSQIGLQYLINVFKLSGKDLDKNEALSYMKSGFYNELTIEQLDQFLEPNDQNICILKQDMPLQNIMEIFFDKQFVFEGFQLSQLSQDIDKVLYDSLDFTKEIQYRFFTKQFFVDYFIKCIFKNEIVLQTVHTQALVFFELMIDFIYQTLITQSEKIDPNIHSLYEKICEDKSVFQCLKQESIIFIESKPNTKELTDQLLKRVEARLSQLEKIKNKQIANQ